ncbi:MAG: hypothetical protein QM775_32910 [Pirellulales bacterium]
MATTYTSKVSVRCVKQHTCVTCASKYSYTLVRNLQGTGGTAAAAEAAAEKAAIKSVQSDVDFHPCPACGAVQPEMAAEVVNKRFWIAGIIGVIGVIASLILGLSRALHTIPAAYVGAASTLAAALIAVWANMYAPNRNVDGNRRKSELNINAGKLRLDERTPAKPDAMLQFPAAQKKGHRVAAVLLAAAVVTTLVPAALQLFGGWPTNTTTYPEVVGAGDTARIYFDEKITSINGKWVGQGVKIGVINADKLGVAMPRVSGTTNDSSWGDTISGKNVSNATNRMYVDVKFGEQPDLAGKELALNLEVKAEYPYELSGGFENRSSTFKHKTSLTLGPAGSGGRLHRSFWEGELMAGALLIVGLLVASKACKSLRAEGAPTTVFNADNAR